MLVPCKATVCIFKTLFGLVFQDRFRNSRGVEPSSVYPCWRGLAWPGLSSHYWLSFSSWVYQYFATYCGCLLRSSWPCLWNLLVFFQFVEAWCGLLVSLWLVEIDM